MNFKVGDIVKTRDGYEIEILKVDALGKYPIIGVDCESGSPDSWTAEGYISVNSNYTVHGRNLIIPKRTREVTVWVNVHPSETYVYNVKEDAECWKQDALAVAVKHTFILEY